MNMSEAMVLSVFLFKCVMNTLSKLVLLMSVNFVVSVCVCVCLCVCFKGKSCAFSWVK